MAYWIQKEFPIDGWAKVQDRFEEHFMALKGPRDMMLICVDAPDLSSTTLYAALPDEGAAILYDGFGRVSEEQLPKQATLLMGHADRFEELFDYPKTASGLPR